MGTTQSAIARLESAVSSPKVATLQAYGDAVELELEFAPPDLVSAAARTVGERLAADDADGALRALIQLHDDLARPVATSDLRREPGSCGKRTWDAAIAAVVERVARRRGLPIPGWTAAPSRSLDHPWFPLSEILGRPIPVGLACLALATSPSEFAARGIHLDPATLESC